MVLEQVCSKVRQRLLVEGLIGELSEEEKVPLLAQWIAKDMKDLDLLLKHHLGQGEILS